MNAENLIALLIAAPLLGAAVLLTGGRRLDAVGHWIGTLLAGASFVFGAILFADLLGKDAEHRTLTQHLWAWIPVEGFQADVAFRLDQLSMTFVLLITGVGSLIHLYSIGYMEHDERRAPLLRLSEPVPRGASPRHAVPAARRTAGQVGVGRLLPLLGFSPPSPSRSPSWSASTRTAPATSSPNRTPGSRTSGSATNWAWTASRWR